MRDYALQKESGLVTLLEQDVILHVRNVEEAYWRGLERLRAVGDRRPSRNGDVLVAPHPVMTVYERPTERVLTDPQRDANPFFHLFESLWMLSGSCDASWLDQFVGDFSARYAEPGTTNIHGAYGHRWRNHWDQDQLEVAVRRLRSSPDDRRVVISMWDPGADLLDPAELAATGGGELRDVPCNTHIYPRLRDEAVGSIPVTGAVVKRRVLDLTVCCRSNDVVWGAYGANAVHFSVLQEYLAGRLGAGVGRLYQLSNNWHGYVPVLEKCGMPQPRHIYDDPGYGIAPLPMGTDWDAWDDDVRWFMESPLDGLYRNDWFPTTAVPMLWAHTLWRRGERAEGLDWLNGVAALDWRRAAAEWMTRRMGR